jgi:chromate transporter
MSALDPSRASLLTLARVLAGCGNSTVGGGTATLIEIERELIDRRQWLSREESRMAYAISRLTPGTNLLAYSVAIGWQLGRFGGAVIALLAVSLPGAVAAALLTQLLAGSKAHPALASALSTLLAAAIAIMIGAVWAMMRPFLADEGWRRSVIFAACGLVMSTWTTISPPALLIAAAIVGALTPQRPRT